MMQDHSVVEKENLCWSTPAQIRALARVAEIGGGAIAFAIVFVVRSPQTLAALLAPRNFRAVSACADTARNQNNGCIVAPGATICGGRYYGHERRDI